MQVTSNRNSRINRFSQSPSFSQESYFATNSPTNINPTKRPQPLEKVQTKKSQIMNVERTTMIKSPLEVLPSKQVIYSQTPMVSSQMLVGEHFIRTNSPAVSRVRVSPPRTSILTTGSSRVVVPTTSIVPVVPMTTTVSPMIVSPQSYSIQSSAVPTVTHYETIKETVNENATQVQRLQNMNDFLTENYTLVYNKLRQLQQQQARTPKDIRPPTQTVTCINQSWLSKALVGKIDQICDFEIESTLNKFRSINLNARTFKSTTITRFN